MTHGTVERVGAQRCVYCSRTIVEAWVCIDCAVEQTGFRLEDTPASTATKASKSMQRLRDRAAACEQHAKLQGLRDGMDSETVRIRAARIENSDPRLGRAFMDKVAAFRIPGETASFREQDDRLYVAGRAIARRERLVKRSRQRDGKAPLR